MRREDMADLTMFLAVAEEQSFTGAAKKLGVSQSALSHTVRRLETRLGLRLLTRTTRSVAPTEAGERLLETLRPAIDEIDERLAALTLLRERPAGTIRINASEHAAETILWPAIDGLVTEYPDIHVEVHVESGFSDIVADRFDAGVRLGEALAKDMIAVRISPRLRMAAVSSPAYFAEHGTPIVPQDLAAHRCINLRMTSAGGIYAWEFEKDGRELRVKVDGQLVFNRIRLILGAAAAGHGIGYVLEDQAAPLLSSGALVRVLEDWSPPFDGYYLYYPSRRQTSPAFRLVVDRLRYRD
ncbi:MAG: LysR family transcriptional regulator [Sphingomonas sp.]|uniref:LysR family transcriptional regulator n=1 Tax=Sphingomonas sp. TaxID=28214 RepID=UPI0026238F50|nr:LysR family transcriptional regulator [Sphingomonas sp.]MDK2770344.1 LysR family transcriptional regulator [Sphingomonas sp.]